MTDSPILESEPEPAVGEGQEVGCNFESVPLPVALRWAGLSGEVQELAIDGQLLTFEVEPNTDAPLTVALTAHLALDELRVEVPLALIELIDGQSQSADLDLSAYADNIASLQFTGRVRLSGTIDDGQHVIALPNLRIYVHENEEGHLVAYDRRQMIDVYDGGDIHGTFAEEVADLPPDSYIRSAGIGVVTEATGEDAEDDA